MLACYSWKSSRVNCNEGRRRFAVFSSPSTTASWRSSRALLLHRARPKIALPTTAQPTRITAMVNLELTYEAGQPTIWEYKTRRSARECAASRGRCCEPRLERRQTF